MANDWIDVPETKSQADAPNSEGWSDVGERKGTVTVQGADPDRERRVGKECLRLCRSRWSPYH